MPEHTPEPGAASPFLAQKLEEIRARMAELEPLVEEFHLLSAADLALSGDLKPPRPPGRPKTPPIRR